MVTQWRSVYPLKCLFSCTSGRRMKVLRRIVCAIGCLLLAGSFCGAAQAPAERSAAVDALVKKLVGPVSKSKMKNIVVVGFSGPGKTVTDLGTMLRDAVSDALAHEVPEVKVIDRA